MEDPVRVFERWRGVLFWVCLVFGLAAVGVVGFRLVEDVADLGGLTAAEAFDFALRIGTSMAVLWLAWVVFRRRAPRSE
jgi:hypothetical protein